MGPVSAEITIDAPRERVFDLLVDLSVRPAFTDHFVERFHLLRVEPSGVGAGARFHARAAGGWLDSTIVEANAPHLLIERGLGGQLNRVPNVTEWRLAPAFGGSGCTVRVTFATEPASLVDQLAEIRCSERRLTRAWQRALSRLRELAERAEPPPRVAIAGLDRI